MSSRAETKEYMSSKIRELLNKRFKLGPHDHDSYFWRENGRIGFRIFRDGWWVWYQVNDEYNGLSVYKKIRGSIDD